MKKIFIIPILVLLIAPSAMAQETQYTTTQYCDSNNVTLIHFKSVKWIVVERNITRTLNVTENETCQFGCNTISNECVKPPWVSYAIVLAVVILGAIIYAIFFR